MSKYYKNFILYGDAESYCLLCDEMFEDDEEIEKHIRWEQHRKVFKTQTLMNKFKNDRIYKIENNFYCEICNFLAPKMRAITSHVKSDDHIAKKSAPTSEEINKLPIKIDSDCVIVSKVIVNKEEWNAIVNGYCVLCDVAFNNNILLNRHIIDPVHIVNVIQAKVFIEDDSRCYRKIKEGMIYCFICKKIVTDDPIASHWEDKEHIDNSNININKKTTQRVKTKSKDDFNRELIQECKRLFVINIVDKTAVCKTCDAVVNFNTKLMSEHAQNHNKENYYKSKEQRIFDSALETELKPSEGKKKKHLKQKEIIDNGQRRKELAELGKEIYIKLLPGGSKGYCLLCRNFISGNKFNFMLHTLGKLHRGYLQVMGVVEPETHPLANYESCLLQDYLCMTKCFACDVYYMNGKDDEHIRSNEHKQRFLEATVVTSLPGEFVREIRQNLFHCGYCNKTFPFWCNLEKHLSDPQHKRNKETSGVMTTLVEGLNLEAHKNILSQDLDVMYYQLLSLEMFDSSVVL